MDWLSVGLVSLFFLVLIGQYVYREAVRENRSSPALRAVCWTVFGVVGVVRYLVHIRERDPNRLGWVGLSALLVALWGIGTIGLWGLSGGFYLWGGLFAGFFVLYWQCSLEQERGP
ncbi:hypothetical protein ACOZ4I_13135 [Haloarcula salina]|uniref:hypothetical protein n=1 Tax=Haloarcula salina TaxID=1429914 RepID=UPI003C6EDCCC